MKFSKFSKLEDYYVKRYNYYTDRLENCLTIEDHRRVEQKVMFYDRKLSSLYGKSGGIIYEQ